MRVSAILSLSECRQRRDPPTNPSLQIATVSAGRGCSSGRKSKRGRTTVHKAESRERPKIERFLSRKKNGRAGMGCAAWRVPCYVGTRADSVFGFIFSHQPSYFIHFSVHTSRTPGPTDQTCKKNTKEVCHDSATSFLGLLRQPRSPALPMPRLAAPTKTAPSAITAPGSTSACQRSSSPSARPLRCVKGVSLSRCCVSRSLGAACRSTDSTALIHYS